MSLKRAIGDLNAEIASHSAAISNHQAEIKKSQAALSALGTSSAGTVDTGEEPQARKRYSIGPFKIMRALS